MAVKKSFLLLNPAASKETSFSFVVLSELMTYLHSGLGEPDPHGDLLPHEDVRVVRLGEAALQLVELGGREPRAVPLLLAARLVVAGGRGLVRVAVRGAVQPLARRVAGPCVAGVQVPPLQTVLQGTAARAAGAGRRLEG